MKIPGNVILGVVLILGGGGYELYARKQYSDYREAYKKEFSLFDEARMDEVQNAMKASKTDKGVTIKFDVARVERVAKDMHQISTDFNKLPVPGKYQELHDATSYLFSKVADMQDDIAAAAKTAKMADVQKIATNMESFMTDQSKKIGDANQKLDKDAILTDSKASDSK